MGHRRNVLSSNDYNLVTAINNQGCLAATPITVVDNFPVSPALCGQAIPPCPFPPCNDLDAVQSCPTCEHIDTQTFEWERLNTAALDALHLTTAAGGYDYLGAISLLNELLMYDESSINNKEQYVIDYSYDKIKEALGNAFKNDLIPVANNTSTVNISVAKVIEVEDKFIANAIINDDYFERFFVSLDKVQTHRIAGNLDMALALLGDMSNWAETDEQSIVNSWICFLTIELGILNNTILIEDIEPSIYACSGSNPNRIIQQMSNEILYGYETVNNISLQPNPTKTGFNILSTDGTSDYEIEIYNAIGISVQQNILVKGKYVDCSKLSSGVYHVKLKNTKNNFVTVEKLVVE
ncbi:MAG: T9SS type A sorting domain-containing protein [Bacteroidetes bacterium]|nr:T9SS type A sorting domain-containing protein [Bacteroidota bacterium]